MTEGKAVRESISEYSELALPNDANGLGNVLGGKVMHLVDLAGAMAAMRHARRTQSAGASPASRTRRPASSCACPNMTELFMNHSACGATVVTSRTGQLTEFTGASKTSNMGKRKFRRTMM